MIFGALIVFFLIVEPHGLARLWAIGQGEAAAMAVPALSAADSKALSYQMTACAPRMDRE